MGTGWLHLLTRVTCLALAGALIAGCMERQPDPDFTYEIAGDPANVPGQGAAYCAGVGSWVHPGLFATLRESPNASTRSPPNPPLPFDASRVHAPWSDFDVTRVTWTPAPASHDEHGSYHRFFIEPDTNGSLRVHALLSRHDPHDMRAHFDAFLSRVTENASEADRDAWFRALVDSGEWQGDDWPPPEEERDANASYVTTPWDGSFEVSVNATPALESLWAEVDANATRRTNPDPPWVDVEWTAGDGEWVFRVTLARMELKMWPDEGPLRILVDASDRVHAGAIDAYFPDDRRAWILGAFADAGLPEPEFREWREDRSIC